MARNNIYSLSQQRKQSAAAKNMAFMEFFETLDEAVEPFKSGYRMPKANAGDSRVSVRRRRGKPEIRFEFLAKGDNHIVVDLDVRALVANPKEYIDNMLECLDAGMKQAAQSSRIIIPVGVSSSYMKAVH